MRFIQARANEFLVTSRAGRLTNRGAGGSALVLPGATWVKVSGAKQEACFAMTQESRDGIPLRFKGIVIYRVVDPVAAVRSFRFAGDDGHRQIRELVADVCLGELRDVVSHMTMKACIEERKTTLTDTVAGALGRVVTGNGAESGWGIALELVQVAQVFIVDEALRLKLEAELRNDIAARAAQSDIQMQEQVSLAKVSSERRLAAAELERERESAAIATEKLELEQTLATARIEAETPTARRRLAAARELCELELELAERQARLKEVEAARDLALARAKQDLEERLLPLKQMPQVAESLGKVFQNTDLSLYGTDNVVTSTLAPLVDLVARRLRLGDATLRGVSVDNTRENA
jgi:flotillin